MESRLRVRLAGMMFLHYLSLGAWAVPLATYLLTSPAAGGLGFSAGQVALVYSTLAIAGILAPLFLGLFADQWFAAEKLMAAMYVIGAALMFGLAYWCEHQFPLIRAAFTFGSDSPEWAAANAATFWTLLAVMQCVSFTVLMSTTMSNVISLRNLTEPRKTFGSVRLFGTVAWMVAGVSVGWLLDPLSPQMLFFAGTVLLVMAAYCLIALPHTPPSGRSGTVGEMIGLPALTMLRDPSFAVFLVCAMCMSMVQQFYTLYANKFLTDIGVPKPTAVQTIAQSSEVLCMALFPLAFARMSVRQMMLIGLVGWVVRNALFATESPWVVIGLALPLHGLCYTFFFVVATLYVDRHAPPHLRASAQGVFVFATSGLGAILGNGLSATVTHRNTTASGTAWTEVWLVPAGIAVVVLVLFAAMFKGEPQSK